MRAAGRPLADPCPHAQQAALPPLDLGPLHTPPPARSRAQGQAQLSGAVALATTLHAALTPRLGALDPPVQGAVQGLLDLLSKVIADETTTDAQGQVVERLAGEKGQYRLASAVDVAATFRKHDADDVVFGYNAAIATTATRIRAAVVATGSAPDSGAPVAVLEQQRAAALPLPPEVIMDQAGGWGKTRAAVATVSDGQTQMVALIPQAGGADLTRFTPADFQVSADGQSCTCPHQVVSTKAYASGEGDGVHFRFTAKQCQGCPFWAQCRTPDSKPTSHRTVYVTPYHAHLRAGAACNATPRGKLLLSWRWQVEPAIAWLVRYNGMRQARRVGQAAAQCQLYQGCAVRNLWRYLGRLARQRAAPPPLGAGA
ncbi:MAG: transposase [Chloroflexota bacterium]|nr:transposase [Chloroflexota bacterium]